jgi:exopolysaccharide biosynthesis polyprenyl glycosylphosphotransferase
MNATERQALLQSAAFYEELNATVDERTLEIIERRRRTATVRRRGWLVRRALLAADIVGLGVAFSLAQLLFWNTGGTPDQVNVQEEFLLFALTLPAWVVVAKLHGLYDRDDERTDHSTADDIVGVFHLVTVGAWLFFAGSWLSGVGHPALNKVFTFWALGVVLVSLARSGARAFSRRRVEYLQNTVIVGAGDVGQLIASKLLKHPEYGINLVGFVDDEPKERRADLEHLTLLGSVERLPGIIRLFDVERVIIAFSRDSHTQALDLIRSVKDLDVQVDIVPRLFEIVGPSVGIHTVEGIPLVGLPPLRLSRSSKLLKRTLDVSLALVGLILLAPVFALIAAAIKRGSPGPVFFSQIRMGSGGKTFRMYKFRTMTADADARKAEVAHLNKHATNGGDARMFKVPNDPRMTHVGRFLRRHSLDELPQLINVLKGEMSLVGPRPLILDEDQHVREWARQRLNLKPGMTGPWQVLGRSQIPFEEMVKIDYLYVTSWSLWTDVQLILRTVPVVLATSRTTL